MSHPAPARHAPSAGQPGAAQWARVEAELSRPFGWARLLCDGYEVTLKAQSDDGGRQGIAVYVGGDERGRWLIDDCEARRRFCRPEQRHQWPAEARAELLRLAGGLGAPEATRARIERRTIVWLPWWPAFEPLRRQLLARNRRIEVLRIGEQTA